MESEGCYLSLNFNFTPQNIKIHDKIAGQTIKGVLESGRFIFLEKEMSNPCKTISHEWHKPQKMQLS